MNKQIPIFICIFILLALAVTAVPPVLQATETSQGLLIEYPKYESIKINDYFRLHSHVITALNGTIVTNETTNCFLHIYNKTGDHILKNNMDWDETSAVEYELYISPSNFSTLGSYAYIIQCNGSLGGGFVSGLFDVTEDGNALETLKDSTASISIMLFILLINGVLFILPFKLNFTKNEWSNFAIKRSIIVIGIYLMVLNSAIAASIAEISGLPITNEMFRYMWFFGIAGYVSILYLVFTTVIGTIKLWKNQQAKMRMGEE